mgnify:CR=1 FL=1
MTESDNGAGGKAQQDRFYKLVGGVVVGLVAAVALLPLLFGGEEREEPRGVEIEPPLREQPAQSATPEEASSSPEAGQTGGGAGDDSEKWWRSDADGQPAGGEAPSQAAKPSQPEGTDASPAREETAASEPKPDSSAQTAEASGKAPDRSPEPDKAQTEGSASDQRDSAGASAASPDQATAEDAAQDAGDNDPAEPESGGFWAVMVGSFQERGNAQSLVERLKEQGFSAEVHAAQVSGDTWNRVLVGEAESRKEANALIPRLKEAGYRDMLLMEVE